MTCAAGVLALGLACGGDPPAPRLVPGADGVGDGGGEDEQVADEEGPVEERGPSTRHEIQIIPGPEGGPSDAPGVIRGVVVFDGEPPKRREIQIGGSGCPHEGPPQLKQDLVVTDGKVQYAYVYVDSGVEEGAFSVPKDPVYLDQVGCMYEPHVLCVQVGQELLVRNSDQTLHNVNWPDGNKMQPAGSSPLEIVYEGAEAGLMYRCDIHPWMSAFICAADHPFQQVTGEDGEFSLPEIAPGRYELVLWTEKFKKDRALPAFEVPSGGEVIVTFHLSDKSGRRRRRGR